MFKKLRKSRPVHVPVNPVHTGFAWKEGGNIKSWKRRWFVFTPPNIEYYRKANSDFIKGWDIMTAIVEETPRSGRPNAFTITTAHRALVISPETPEERDAWIRKLRTRIILHRFHATQTDFKPIRVISRNERSTVSLVRHKTGALYAMKSRQKTQVQLEDLVEQSFAERDALFEINHPFLVGARYCFQTDTKLCLVMEYLPGGHMHDRLQIEGSFSEDRARLYIAELVLAIGHVHKCHRIHRDIKAEHVLFDQVGHVRIIDFGLVKRDEGGTTAMTICGTWSYMAPEIYQSAPYGAGVDWWALGILSYEMLTGHVPFDDPNWVRVGQRVLREEILFPGHISPVAKDFISKLCTKTPANRLGYGENGTEDVKRHPFFATIDWQAIHERRLPMPWVPPRLDEPAPEPEEEEVAETLSQSMQELFEAFSTQNEVMAKPQIGPSPLVG
jgi:serine/threonine protein kinase